MSCRSRFFSVTCHFVTGNGESPLFSSLFLQIPFFPSPPTFVRAAQSFEGPPSRPEPRFRPSAARPVLRPLAVKIPFGQLKFPPFVHCENGPLTRPVLGFGPINPRWCSVAGGDVCPAFHVTPMFPNLLNDQKNGSKNQL